MNLELSEVEARLIGCLMEKSITTPDQYPLTLNGLTSACNQKSSREPVMTLDQGLVQRTARQLEEKNLVTVEENFRSRVMKYSQRMCNTTFGKMQFNDAEFALVCVLLLRGAQTPGELRTRAARLHTFADNSDVADTLSELMSREDGPYVARLPRKPSRHDAEFMHLFYGHIESAPEEAIAPRAAPSGGSSQFAELSGRVDELEREVMELKALVQQLTE